MSSLELRLKKAVVNAIGSGVALRNYLPRLDIREGEFRLKQEYGETDIIGALIISEGIKPKTKKEGMLEYEVNAQAIMAFMKATRLSEKRAMSLIWGFDLGKGSDQMSRVGARIRSFVHELESKKLAM